MELFVGMSKREIFKAIEDKEVEVYYYETDHQIPKFLSLQFKEEQSNGKKHFGLYFNKYPRRVYKEFSYWERAEKSAPFFL